MGNCEITRNDEEWIGFWKYFKCGMTNNFKEMARQLEIIEKSMNTFETPRKKQKKTNHFKEVKILNEKSINDVKNPNNQYLTKKSETNYSDGHK